MKWKLMTSSPELEALTGSDFGKSPALWFLSAVALLGAVCFASYLMPYVEIYRLTLTEMDGDLGLVKLVGFAQARPQNIRLGQRVALERADTRLEGEIESLHFDQGGNALITIIARKPVGYRHQGFSGATWTGILTSTLQDEWGLVPTLRRATSVTRGKGE
jgi:hypothetical protein